MAVARVDFVMDGLIEGTLVITDKCVFIDSTEGAREMVVWPDFRGDWRWDSETEQIVSLRYGHQTRNVPFSSGDLVVLGGADVDLEAQQLILQELEWIAPPRDGCMTEIVYFSNGEISAQ